LIFVLKYEFRVLTIQFCIWPDIFSVY